MYTEDYETRGFPFRNFLLKLILIIVFAFLLVWLLPKLINPTIVSKTNAQGKKAISEETSANGNALTSQIFMDNLERMKNAAISYYTEERLPKNIGGSETMTLSDMIGKKLIIALIDKNNKACDVDKSYVKITKVDNEYILKVNLKDSEKEDYILVHLGCYSYCDSYVCQKAGTGYDISVKNGKITNYVPIKGGNDNYVIIRPQRDEYIPICVYNSTKGQYFGINGTVVSKDTFIKQCGSEPEKEDYVHACMYNKTTGQYFGITGDIVSKEQYKKECANVPEDKHYCVKYNGHYYDNKGNIVSYEEYKRACIPEDKHYCVKYNGHYYDNKGNIVSYEEYKKACTTPDKHYCVKYNGHYYDNKGNMVSYEEYKKACVPEDKHYCVKYNGHYYDNKGNIVSYEEYKKACTTPDKHYCVYYNGKYYDDKGNVVSYDDYKKACVPEVTYIYEYTKTTGTQLSNWSKWSEWTRTNCATTEINCKSTDSNCLLELQRYNRKEKIGTYTKKYTKTRQVLKQTGSYQQKTCSKFNYVIINNTTYATTYTTTYTAINTVTTTTSGGAWVKTGTGDYKNPPAPSATTQYKFVGANFDPCQPTCQTLPTFYYDTYTYTGGLNSVNTTTSIPTSSSTSIETTTSTDVSVKASCGEYVIKTVPIYSYITVTDIANRTEPLYGNVCYQSTRNRTILSQGSTQYKWSKYNDTTLLNNGWTYTGARKVQQ